MMEKTYAVRYFSRGGNTKKLADAIASAVGVEAKAIPVAVSEPVDILFLGAAVYWGGIDGKVRDYIKTLSKDAAKEVVVFSNSSLAERAYPGMKKLLEDRGLTVRAENFYCRGQFSALYKGRPNQTDLAAAAEFAKKI